MFGGIRAAKEAGVMTEIEEEANDDPTDDNARTCSSSVVLGVREVTVTSRVMAST